MPLIYLNCPVGTFKPEAKKAMAEELTTAALKLEKLPDSDFVRSTVWIYINEYPSENVYHGGSSIGTNVISMEVNAFKGGLDDVAKQLLVEQFTFAISKNADIGKNKPIPAYIIIREIDENDWGIFGKIISLESVRNSPVNLRPI
ncbi:4-oxalocrotonate tautomerase [Pedobacter frigidisoli]|uniref:4-oxalocrotonate tautomerase n=1 Tax=Pedobacter frigidisoli TaxID=2530455 RepID=A0A4V2MKG0_9SPHI|nr:tautomerase family protein [Pedobacter frigidisoli]TCC97966.1 4-oxalocrotonate tautomerase [Pedobacter frigidisoli]